MIFDAAAALIFLVCWLGYEPVLHAVAERRGALAVDMAHIRTHWMRRMIAREGRIADSNLLGHLINSASFFASSNLLLIAAAASALFGGEAMLRRIESVAMAAPAPDWLLEAKIALVLLSLSRGLLDFIWAIRQLNYCGVIVGAAPKPDETPDWRGFARAASAVMAQAIAAFNRGVRGYYFSMAAAAWLFSPWAMAVGAAAAAGLLLWRQTLGHTAKSVREVRERLEAEGD